MGTTQQKNAIYLYFLVVEGNIPLLKKEILQKYPDLKLSFSSKTFLTYKAEHTFKTDQFKVIFSTHYGVSQSKILKNSEEVKAPSKDSIKIQIDLNSYIWGEKAIHSPPFPIAVEQKRNVPSRAYHKIEDAFTVLNPPQNQNALVFDIGSSPGGSSLFFLEKGYQVIGIDSGEMDEKCLSHKNFSHFKMPLESFQNEMIKDFYEKISYIAIDINLDPFYVLSEMELFFKKLGIKRTKDIEGLFFTIKMTKKFNPFDVARGSQKICERLLKLGFNKSFELQLPSHHQEFLIAVLK